MMNYRQKEKAAMARGKGCFEKYPKLKYLLFRDFDIIDVEQTNDSSIDRVLLQDKSTKYYYHCGSRFADSHYMVIVCVYDAKKGGLSEVTRYNKDDDYYYYGKSNHRRIEDIIIISETDKMPEDDFRSYRKISRDEFLEYMKFRDCFLNELVSGTKIYRKVERK